MIEEDMEHYVLAAFTLGLFSFILRPFNKDILIAEVEKVDNRLTRNDFDAPLTSAEYVRDIIADVDDKKENLLKTKKE